MVEPGFPRRGGDGPLLPKGGYQPIILAIFPGRLHELLDMMGGYTSWPKASILSLHVPLYSAKPQQSMRQRSPFSNDNETNATKSYQWQGSWGRQIHQEHFVPSFCRASCVTEDYLKYRSFKLFWISVIIWTLDRIACGFWLAVRFPYLHSILHVTIFCSVYPVGHQINIESDIFS